MSSNSTGCTLPYSWREQSLGSLNVRQTCTINPALWPEETFEYYSIPAYQSGQRPAIAKGKEIGSSKLLLQSGTLLFGKLNPRVEKIWRVMDFSAGRKIGSTEWIPIVPGDDIDSGFLYYLLWSEHVMPIAKTLVSGSTPSRQRVDPKSFYRILVPLPAKEEQKQIAAVLSLVQRAIEQQERLIELTVELKKALLHQLFTHGLRHEPQKQTDLGPIPQSWKAVELESVVVAFDYGTSVKCDYEKAGFPVLRIPNVVSGSIDVSDLKHGQPKRTEIEPLRLTEGDLLFVRTNGVQENAGRCGLFRGELPDCYFASYLIRVRTNPARLLPAFLNQYAETERGKDYLAGRAIRTADGKFNINSGTLRRVVLPLPTLAEQKEIVRQLDFVEQKCQLHRRKHAALSDLFRTLLHELMTARLRVDHLDLPELETFAEAEA